MPLRDYQYKGITDLMKRGIEPTFRALATAGFELADNFFKLHSKGLCYRDISFGNVFFNPDNGRVLICDNDNVDIDQTGKQSGVLGTPRFMAPEIVRGEATPSTRTDLFSLAVLLFYIRLTLARLRGKCGFNRGKQCHNRKLDCLHNYLYFKILVFVGLLLSLPKFLRISHTYLIHSR
jgi:serine/threonine protein kinase